MGFLKLIVQVFFVCVELSWVGGEGWEPERWGPEGWGPRRVGARRVGPQTQNKWGPEGWGPPPRKSGSPKGGGQRWGFEGWGPEGWEVQNFALFFGWGTQMCTFGVLGLSCEAPAGSSKHHQKSTRRHPEREEKNEFCGGRGKKRAKFWGGPGRGRSWEGGSREGRSWGRST